MNKRTRSDIIKDQLFGADHKRERPRPKMYTEEEVKALCKKAYYNDGDWNEFWKFWLNNKKK